MFAEGVLGRGVVDVELVGGALSWFAQGGEGGGRVADQGFAGKRRHEGGGRLLGGGDCVGGVQKTRGMWFSGVEDFLAAALVADGRPVAEGAEQGLGGKMSWGEWRRGSVPGRGRHRRPRWSTGCLGGRCGGWRALRRRRGRVCRRGSQRQSSTQATRCRTCEKAVDGAGEEERASVFVLVLVVAVVAGCSSQSRLSAHSASSQSFLAAPCLLQSDAIHPTAMTSPIPTPPTSSHR